MSILSKSSITKTFMIFIFCISLTACLSPVKTSTETKYMVDTVPTNTIKARRHSATILVSAPDSRPIYNTNRMAYSSCPHQIAYFGVNQWAETPATMLQPLLVNTLQNTLRFKAVITPPFVGHHDYQINSQILRFQQDFSHCPASFDLLIRVQLINARTYQVIGTKEIAIHEIMTAKTPNAGVYAANRAVAKALGEIAKLVVTKTR